MIPYVISEAYPDYKRPSLEQDFGVVKEEEMKTYFLDRICNFILERTCEHDLKCQYDIEKFFQHFFDECFMRNLPWDALVFINGEWENMTPSYEQIWEHIQLLKLQEKEDEEQQENTSEETLKEEKQEQHDILDENDKLILTNIKSFFEQMLEEKPLTHEQIETLQQMNQIGQLTSLFNIYLTHENYTKNKNLFQAFLNLCLKFLQKDIEEITRKMEIEHSDELSKQLRLTMEVYSNTLFIKQSFNI